MSRRITLPRSSLPAKIKIGVFEYDLLHMDAAASEADACLGDCDEYKLLIRVWEDLPDSKFAEVLEHEINHACWAAAKLKSRAAEETVVNRMTPVLMAARRDNPEIYAWIDRAIAQKE